MKFFFFILSAWLPNRHTYYSHGVNHLDLRDLDQKMSSAGRALCKEHRGDGRTLCCALGHNGQGSHHPPLYLQSIDVFI